MNLFLETVKGYHWDNIYLLAAETGMRDGELLGIHRNRRAVCGGRLVACRCANRKPFGCDRGQGKHHSTR
jgi:hypothetical protein